MSSLAMPFLHMRAALVEQEQRVARDLWDAERFRLPHQEETVTETLFLGLARDRRMRGLRTVAYSKREEGRNGADWLWIFRGHTGGVFAVLVQAKRLKGERGGIYAVNQLAAEGERNRSGNPRLQQRSVLLRAAAVRGVPALYAFYNDAGSASMLHEPCPWRHIFGPLGGITLQSAQNVEDAVNAHRIRSEGASALSVSPDARAMSCALLCRGHVAFDAGDDQPLNELVADSVALGGLFPQADLWRDEAEVSDMSFDYPVRALAAALDAFSSGADDIDARHGRLPDDEVVPFIDGGLAEWNVDGVAMLTATGNGNPR